MILAESPTKQDLWPAHSFLHPQHSGFDRTSAPGAKVDLGKKQSGCMMMMLMNLARCQNSRLQRHF